VLECNQIFLETLIAATTANSASQRLGAIVHTAIFDACNGIEQRYSPIFVRRRAPGVASSRAAIVAAAHATLVDLFPSQKPRWMPVMRLWRLSVNCRTLRQSPAGGFCAQWESNAVSSGVSM
jgi:hypothetical protein